MPADAQDFAAADAERSLLHPVSAEVLASKHHFAGGHRLTMVKERNMRPTMSRISICSVNFAA